MTKTPRPSKRWILLAVKIAISVGLIWFVVHTTELSVLTERVKSFPSWLIFVILALLTAQVSIGTWRWCHVAEANRIDLPFRPAARIFLVGLFFNQTLPSSVGGDIFRIWLLHRRGAPLGQATGNVMLDRIIGLEALLLTSLVGIPVLFSTVPGAAPWSILALSLSGMLAFAVLLAFGGRSGAFLDRWRPTSVIRSAARSARRLAARPAKALLVLVLSVSIHLITVLYIATILQGLGQDISFALLATLIPPVLVATVVPISMAGWGVREGAMIFILGIVGVPAADALTASLLLGAGLFVVGLPGGLLWLVDSGTRRGKAEMEPGCASQ